MHASHATRQLLRILILRANQSFHLICIFDDGTTSTAPYHTYHIWPDDQSHASVCSSSRRNSYAIEENMDRRVVAPRLDRRGDKKQQELARVQQVYAGVVHRFCRDILLPVFNRWNFNRSLRNDRYERTRFTAITGNFDWTIEVLVYPSCFETCFTFACV